MGTIKKLLNMLQRSGSTEKNCRTRMIGEKFFECKVKKPNPNYCDHSLSSGGSYICNHQDRESFARK